MEIIFGNPRKLYELCQISSLSIINHNNIQTRTTYQESKATADKLMYIPNDDIQSYPFCRL